jgi:ATP-binding cassette subfamily C protein
MLAEIGRRFRTLPPSQRWQWAALAPFGLASAILEGLGAAAVFALIAVLIDPSAEAGSRAVGALRSLLPGPGSFPTLTWLAALAASVHIAKTLLIAAVTWWRTRLVEREAADLGTRLFRGYLEASWPFHLQRSSAALLETVRGSTRHYFEVFEAAATVLIEASMIAAVGIVALTAAPIPVSVAAVLLVVLLSTIVRVTRAAQRRGGERSAEIGAALYRHVHHGLGAVKEIAILGRRRYFIDGFEEDAEAAAHIQIRRALLAAAPRLVLETAFVLGMLALVMASAAAGSAESVLPLVSLYAYAGFRVIPAAHRMAIEMNNLRWSLGASARLTEDLERTAAAALPAQGDPTPLPFRNALTVEHVSFAYEGSLTPALSDLTVTIRRGESVALVGATGAGKTTLADVLIGLLTPTSGRVLVDGEPIAQRLAEWQRNIGYVPQMPFMLDDTLRRNIAIGLCDDEIDEEAVLQAIRFARLEDLVGALPLGLDTLIGELGVRLSGGERQRIAIARALYSDPALMIFDEATSSLDPGTERRISEAIESIRGARTIIIIAHRLTTVERCDRVLLLSGGRIEASGTIDELRDHSAAFRSVAALDRRSR